MKPRPDANIRRLLTFTRSGMVHAQAIRPGVESMSRSTEFPGSAIAILEADHRTLLHRLGQLVRLRHPLARQQERKALSKALEHHMAVEAEFFYPAFLDATEDSLTHFVASVGHENILAELREALGESTAGAGFVSRVRALKKVFANHVADMEGVGGMFELARSSSMDHERLTQLIRSRYSATALGPCPTPL
jgi:hypothetical protein